MLSSPQPQTKPSLEQSPIITTLAQSQKTLISSHLTLPTHHPKRCIHTVTGRLNPTLIDKLFWHSSRSIHLAIKHFTNFTTGIDNFGYHCLIKLPYFNQNGQGGYSGHKNYHDNNNNSKDKNQFQHQQKYTQQQPKESSGLYLLHTTILNLIYNISKWFYSKLPNFITNRLQPILTFLQKQPLYMYYSYSFYHAPGVLLLSFLVNYILPLILEGLPWFLSPRHLSKSVRDQRALLQQSFFNPSTHFNQNSSPTTTTLPSLATSTANASLPALNAPALTNPADDTNQHPVFPSHLLFRNAPPPILPHMQTKLGISGATTHPPNIFMYTVLAIWTSTINHTLNNLRMWVDMTSHDVINRLVLHTLMSKFEIPNNGNGNNYSSINDSISIGSFFIATNHANILIPNIIRTIYTIYHNTYDLYNTHFVFNSFPFFLLLRPIILAILSEFVSILRSYFSPPPTISSNINTNSFFSTVTASLSDIKCFNLQQHQFEILDRVTKQEKVIHYGPLNVLDRVLQSMQMSGLLDDISESITAMFISHDTPPPATTTATTLVPSLPNNNNVILLTQSSSSNTSTSVSTSVDPPISSSTHSKTQPNTSTIIPSIIPTHSLNISKNRNPDNIAPTITNVSNDIILSDTPTQTTQVTTTSITTSPSLFSKQSISNFLFGGIHNMDSFVIISREVRWIVNSIRRVYNDILQVVGFMLNRPELPAMEHTSSWNEFISATNLALQKSNHTQSSTSQSAKLIKQTEQQNTLVSNGSNVSSSNHLIDSEYQVDQSISELYQAKFYTTFNSIKINAIVYTYPDPPSNTRTLAFDYSSIVYNQILTWAMGLFRHSNLSNTNEDSILGSGVHAIPDSLATTRSSNTVNNTATNNNHRNSFSHLRFTKPYTMGSYRKLPALTIISPFYQNRSQLIAKLKIHNLNNNTNPIPNSQHSLASLHEHQNDVISSSQHNNALSFERGKVYVCCGVNTSGKSTLAQVLSRFLMLSGQSHFHNNEPTRFDFIESPDIIDLDINLTIHHPVQQLTVQIPNSDSTQTITHAPPPFQLTVPHDIIPIQHYRKHVLYLRQKPYIFNATLIDNITGIDHTYLAYNDPNNNHNNIQNNMSSLNRSQLSTSPWLSTFANQSAQQYSSKISPYSNHVKIYPIDYYHDNINAFLNQKLPCVCSCDCGLESCSRQFFPLNNTTYNIVKEETSPNEHCYLSLRWLCWAMFMSGLYNDRGELDNEAGQQQQQQQQQYNDTLDSSFINDSNIHLDPEEHSPSHIVDDISTGTIPSCNPGPIIDGNGVQNLNEFFTAQSNKPNRPWLSQPSQGEENLSFVTRVCHRAFGFDPLHLFKPTQNNNGDDVVTGTDHSTFTPLPDGESCNCECCCEHCLSKFTLDSDIPNATTPTIPLQSPQLDSEPLFNTSQIQSTDPSILSDPKALWESINQIKPIPQKILINATCDEILTRVSSLHPLLAFPSTTTTTTTTKTISPFGNSPITDLKKTPENNKTTTVTHPLAPPSSLLEMFITNNGGNVSGGFAQSIAIARMFIRVHTQYIILDESLSMMDFHKFNTVFPRIIAFSKAIGATVVIISHHLRHIIQHSDYVVFMDKGDIVLFDDIKKRHLNDELHPLFQTLLDS